MSKRNSGYLAKRQAELNHYSRNSIQMANDAFFMAAADMFGLGPKRAAKLQMMVNSYLREVAELVTEDSKADAHFIYAKTKIDNRLKEIFGEGFQSWEERYE